MKLDRLKKEFENELTYSILNYWVTKVYDQKRKTFFGRITNEGDKFKDAPLSAVFITRIMWTFSAAHRVYKTALYKQMADEAYRIIKEHFWDKNNGGIYWSVLPDGTPVDTKKQFYAEAFFIYALSEYYLAFKNKEAKQLAESMFMLMEHYAFDPDYGGYFEATTADWKPTDDRKLSPKELDAEKSMNTHLHILEAYTNLFRIAKNKQVEEKLEHLIRIFLDKILDKKSGHLILFFDKNWKVRSEIDSYGHDIEFTWLICEAAEVLGKKEVIEEVEKSIKKTLDVTINEGFEKNGGLYYEKNGTHLLEEFHWWPQAETVIGFFNGWQKYKHDDYLKAALKNWEFIKKYIVDKKNGEWFWGVDKNLLPLPNDKVNGWKAPYHNSRMCFEMIRRIDEVLD